MVLKSVSVGYKKNKGGGRLRWIDCEAETAKEAYAKIQQSHQTRQLLSEGYREYGIIGLGFGKVKA